MTILYYRELSNRPTAAKRQDFLSHSVIRLGKTLFDKIDRFKAVFWKVKNFELSSRIRHKPKRAYKKKKITKSINNDSKKSVSQSKKVQINPTILKEQKKTILILMNKAIGIKF